MTKSEIVGKLKMPQTIIKEIDIENKELHRYFDKLEKKYNDSVKKTEESIAYLEIAGKYIKLKFASESLKTRLTKSLEFCLTVEPNGVSESEIDQFFIWEGDVVKPSFDDIENEDESNVFLQVKEKADIFIAEKELYLQLFNIEIRKHFVCLNQNQDLDIEYKSHPFKLLFHKWAIKNKLLLIHSAAIQLEDVGILISAVGGRGKSTLSMTCLFEGHGFVGDDYIIMDNKSYAHMVYCTGLLNQDMIDKHSIPRMDIIAVGESQNNKILINLGEFKNNLKKTISIDLILLPQIWNKEYCSIAKINSAKALGQVAVSSVYTSIFKIKKEVVQLVFSYLKGIPIYQINLSNNIKQNVSELEKFVKEWKKENV